MVGLTPISYADHNASPNNMAAAATSFNHDAFIPRPTRNTGIGHTVWSSFLEKTVVVTGQSTRQYAKSRSMRTGTRLAFGHTSRLRLEGNKVYFSKFTDAHQAAIGNYRQQLVDIANKHDITSFPKDEQLAFWYNLHNAVLIETIAANYPLKKPSEFILKDQNRLLHDAKLLNIKGQALSLRDIREKIVYRNWTDPKVIYGFTLGDIGSPSIQQEAFTSDNTDKLLTKSATEFTSSLRGYRGGKVSQIYKDVQSFYFPSFEKDLMRHYNQHMRGDVKDELSEYGIEETARYEDDIMDLVGGSGEARQFSNMSMTGQRGNSVPAHLQGTAVEFTQEIRLKFVELKKMNLLEEGDVTIEDIPTESKK